MEDIENLLKEAKALGILNIDTDGELSPEIIKIAIEETKLLNDLLESDKDEIREELKEVDQIVAEQYK